MKTNFVFFKEYALFIHQNYFDDLVENVIDRAWRTNSELFSLLLKYSNKEAHIILKNIYEDQIFIPLAEDAPFGRIQQKIEAWKDNRGIFPKNKLDIADITFIHNIRKETFLDFIQYYDCSREDLLKLVKEINEFFDICMNLGLQAYKEVHNSDVVNQEQLVAGSKESFGSDKRRKNENYYFPQKNSPAVLEYEIETQKKAEKGFVNLIEEVKDYAIFMLNPDGTVASWNKGAKALKGYSRNEILGKHFSVFYTKEKKNVKFPEYGLEQAKKVGRFEDEGIRVRKDGSTFWANVVITAIYNDQKDLIGFTKITRDLSERKCAEESLRRSEERYRLLIEAVKDYAIFVLDTDGKIASWNEGAKRLTGYTEEEVTGKHFSVFYPQKKVEEKFPEYELEVAAKTGRFEDEGIRVRKDGSTYYANVVITALFDHDNNLIGYSKITRDLTERKRHEEDLLQMNVDLEEKVASRTTELEQRKEELEEAVKELKRINVDLDNFIYTASHDLKAPISNLEGLISAFYQEFDDQVKENPQFKDLQEMIQLSIDKFQSTIKELTEIAKVQKESLEGFEEVDIKDVIEDVKVNISDAIVKNNAQIILDLDNCPKIKFVRRNLRSIFYNFISNAIKYRSPDRTPEIKITCKKEDQNYLITCSDNGIGVKKESIGKMFTMFKRFHTHVEGSGIGLYIVKRIIENVGGKIEVESREGEGTTFKVRLPLM